MRCINHYTLILYTLFLLAEYKITAQAPVWAWAQAFGSEQGANFGRAIAVDPVKGDVYVTGSFSDTTDFDPNNSMHLLETSKTNSFISKMDRDGNLLWAKSMEGGTNYSTAIVFTSYQNGSIFMLGYFTDTVDFDPGPGVFELITDEGTESVYLTKLDVNGSFLWAKEISSEYTAIGKSLEVITSGKGQGIYIAGSYLTSIDADPGGNMHLLTASDFYVDAFVLKLDLNGQFEWAKNFKNTKQDECVAITSDAKGNLYITGTFRDTIDFDPQAADHNLHISTGSNDAFLLKLNSDGKVAWSKTWGGTSTDQPRSIIIDKYGNAGIYLTGNFHGTADFDPEPLNTDYATSNGDADMFISRLDEDGQHLWTKTLGGIMSDRGWDLITNPFGNGDVIITGQWEDDVDFDPGPGVFQVAVEDNATCIFVMRFDKAGNFMWVKPVGNGNGDSSEGIAMDYAGNIYLAGSMNSGSLYFDTILVAASSPTQTGGQEILIARLGMQNNTSVSHLDSITIYPIPAISELTIDFHEARYVDVDILLYTMLGQLIYSNAYDIVSGKTTIDISYLPAAMYALELRYNGKRRVEKVIKL